MLTWNWTIFLLGAGGAFAPEVVRLWGIRTDPGKFSWSIFYLVVSLLFCATGGLFAVAMEPDTAWKSIYAGLSMPVLITTILKKAGDRRAAKGPTKGLVEGAAPPAMPKPTLRAFLDAL